MEVGEAATGKVEEVGKVEEDGTAVETGRVEEEAGVRVRRLIQPLLSRLLHYPPRRRR